MKTAVNSPNPARSGRSAEHCSFQRFSFQHFSFSQRPLFPVLRSGPTAVSGVSPRSKFLAVYRKTEKRDEEGEIVKDAEGEPVMVCDLNEEGEHIVDEVFETSRRYYGKMRVVRLECATSQNYNNQHGTEVGEDVFEVYTGGHREPGTTVDENDDTAAPNGTFTIPRQTDGGPNVDGFPVEGSMGSRNNIEIHYPWLTTGCIVVEGVQTERDKWEELESLIEGDKPQCAQSSNCPWKNIVVKVWYDLDEADMLNGNLGNGNTGSNPNDYDPPAVLGNRGGVPADPGHDASNCNCED